MNSLDQHPPPSKLTRSDMAAVAETKLRDIQEATSGLLQRIDDADPCGAEMLQAEAARLHGIGFTLTRLLCYDDIETAYRIVCGDDVDRTSLGLTT